MNPGNWVFSVISTVSTLACYYIRHLSTNFDIFFVDSKAVELSTVYKYYFLLDHFFVSHQFVNKINVISYAGTT